MNKLADLLDRLSQPGSLYSVEEHGEVRCSACAHRCRLKPGQRGVCKVRHNREGVLLVPWGYVAGAQVDPIEKKPFTHFLPGANAMTFGMLGCNFHCAFCQNWVSSQALRDPISSASIQSISEVSAENLVRYAVHNGAQVMASSYNEPLITTEWALEIFSKAKGAGLKCVYVSNGFATSEALDALKPYLDGFKVDLKCMNEVHYRELGGKLSAVLDAIQMAHQAGMWVEVVTLVIPNYNDSNEELWDTARAIMQVSRDIPWHVTAFHPDYKMEDRGATPPATLLRAAEIGQEAGLNYVYAGNLTGRVGSLENTYCPSCGHLLVERVGYAIQKYQISAGGTCSRCGTSIAGVWHKDPGQVNLRGWGIP